jgi:hypothetical protein
MRESDVWKDMSEQEFGNAKEGMEKLIMNRLYHMYVDNDNSNNNVWLI